MLISTMLYLIEILHQTTTARRRSASNAGCILSKFYIKPQPCVSTDRRKTVVSYRNSTSNHNLSSVLLNPSVVVSYRNSTSNHNLCCPPPNVRWVVSYRNSTSNHNSSRRIDNPAKLYLIEILHQTTTTWRATWKASGLYLIEILHQTTTSGQQRVPQKSLYLIEILHQTTTQASE